ncbi:MAG: trigger factor [Actinomycetes bacterium]
METKVDYLNPTRVKLTIEMTSEELKPSLDHAYEHIAEDVQIPGFRKGKVPAPILEKRVGRPAILAHAVNDALDPMYRSALETTKIRPLAQPEASVLSTPNQETFEGTLKVEIEVEVMPTFELPKYKGLKLKVEEIKVSKDEVDQELDRLRARFGALKTVERPARKGDFTSIDLTATVNGKIVDSAENVSYEIGSGNLLDGIDEALDTLTAGESTTFKSKLVGGELAGTEAEVSLTLRSVKDRELPAADDAFAQLASEFDTLKELRADLEKQVERSKGYGQGIEAREKALDALLALVKIPVSDVSVNQDVERHLEGEGRQNDDKHRAEVYEQSAKSFQVQMLLEAIGTEENVQVTEQELVQHLAASAAQYGMGPEEFIKLVDENGQIPVFASEVARRKALAVVLEAAEVTDTKGKKVDLSDFAKSDAESADEHAGHNH